MENAPSSKLAQRWQYLCAKYYHICILGKDDYDRVQKIAIKQSKISEREAEIIDIQVENGKVKDYISKGI